jgi:membrane-associated protease RseP (regulator of RpoE activity)
MPRLHALLAICIFPAFCAEAFSASAGPSLESLVIGTVVSVNPASAAIVIREANPFGHLRFQVKSYKVKQPSALVGLRAGDRIMAVYSKKDGMLHRLKEPRTSQNRTPSSKTLP